MPIIIVHVVFNSKTVFEWEGLPVNKDMNIQEFFKDVVVDKLNPELWEKNCVAYFSHTKIGETEKIGLECNAWETVNQCGKYVTFKLLNDSNEIPSMNTINAFELMRSASMHNYLPEFKLPAKNSWEQLRIDLNELIRSNGGGWIGKDNANNIGKKFVTDLAKSIWCVDICSYKTFNERFKIPALFTNFFDRAHPEKYKSSRRSFDSEELQRHYKILMNYIELLWMEKPKFAWLKEPLLLYANNLLKYAEYLISQRVITARNQSSLTPVVDEEKAGYIEILDENTWRKPEVVKEFRILTKTLEELEYWEPVNINLFCPVLRKQRFRFVEKLKVAFPFKVGKYTYHHGNIQNSVYVWRIGINVNEQDMINKHYTIRNNLKQTLQVYHTRAMRKEFLDTVELYIGKVEKARMRYIYSVWLQDSAASINSETQDIDDRVEVMFELGDPDLITDFCEINEGRLPKYDVFWEYSSKYLEGIAQESVLAVDDRRHDIFQHLAVAISTRDFRNQEMVILLRMNSWLIFMDDKHRCKVGEPGYPVAAVERGRQVIVSKNKAFKVADHDFTKCGIIPSVTMLCEIPATIDLDLLIAVRTPPGHSWKNPVERIMSILNLGMQSIGLMRDELSNDLENLMKKCNSMEEIRTYSKDEPQLKNELINSLQAPINLMEGIFERLSLKDEPFITYKSATEEEIKDLWESLLEIEDSLNMDDRTKKDIKDKAKLQEFYDHCCKSRHYFFQIKKCGAIDCNICKPIRSDELDFSQVHSLPDPVPIADKTNYKQFEDVYGTITTEQYRPSLLNQQQKKKRAHIEFGPTAQFVRNVGIVIECCECNKWRVLYSKSKLSPFEVSILERYLDTIQYTCGDSFEALVENVEQNESNINGDENSEHDYVGEIFKKVKVDDGLIFNNPTEISYYSSGLFEEICFQCGKVPEDECDESDRPNLNEGFYYYCDECHTTVSSKKKRGKNTKFQVSKRSRK
ncbi:unnamed protein product [Rhizophagus irregularis]|nr:unnamed protein product [Rhizophagus irregularis]